MQYIINWSQQQGFKKIALVVYATNTQAIGLYKKFGFVEEGLQINQIKEADGQYVNLLLMGLWLGGSDLPEAGLENGR